MKTGSAGHAAAKAARVALAKKRARKLRVHQAPEPFDFAMVDPAHARRMMDDLVIGPYPLPAVVAGDRKTVRRLGSLTLTMKRLESLVRRGWVTTSGPPGDETGARQYSLTEAGRQALGRWREPAEGGTHDG